MLPSKPCVTARGGRRGANQPSALAIGVRLHQTFQTLTVALPLQRSVATAAASAMSPPSADGRPERPGRLAQRSQWQEALHQFQSLRRREAFPDAKAAGSLLELLLKAGRMSEAAGVFSATSEVFPDFPRRAVDACVCYYVTTGQFDEARELLWSAHRQKTLNAVLQQLIQRHRLSDAHSLLNEFSQTPRGKIKADAAHFTIMMSGYARAGQLSKAMEVFQQMERCGVRHTVFSFSTMINAYATSNQLEAAQQLFDRMHREGLTPTVVCYTVLLNAYANANQVEAAEQLFRRMDRDGVARDVVTWNSMLKAYVTVNNLDAANALFERMNEEGIARDVVSYNIMLTAFGSAHQFEAAKQLFDRMEGEGIARNVLSYNSLLNAFANANQIQAAEQLFEQMSRDGVTRDVMSWTTMLKAYANSNQFEAAQLLFDRMQCEGITPNVVSYTALLNAYASANQVEAAAQLFERMRRGGVAPNVMTFNTMLKAYANANRLDATKKLFEQMESEGVTRDVVSWTVMLNAYANANQIASAEQLLQRMKREGMTPDLLTCNTMMKAYVNANQLQSALALLDQMPHQASPYTYSLLLAACGEHVAVSAGQRLHVRLVNEGVAMTTELLNSLVLMYGRCGALQDAETVFRSVEDSAVRTEFSWNSMLWLYAQHGMGERALALFEEMKACGLPASDITFAAVLNACSHAGLVDQGRGIFQQFVAQFPMSTTTLNCHVDLLCRSEHFAEALDVMAAYPSCVNEVTWTAVLGACRHSKMADVAIARHAFDMIRSAGDLSSEQGRGQLASAVVVMSDIYLRAGMRDEAGAINAMKKELQLRKIPGITTVEVDKQPYDFFAGDESHPMTAHIHARIRDWYAALEAMPGLGGLNVHGDQDEDIDGVRRTPVCFHSEKLAIAFAAISTPPGTPIVARKNLRVCPDCHHVTKLISKLENRIITIRDANRWHRYEDGKCSCNDFW